jgi:hypothetical protein
LSYPQDGQIIFDFRSLISDLRLRGLPSLIQSPFPTR